MYLRFSWILFYFSIVGVKCLVKPLCQMKCNLEFKPVCASDGQTYINACNMKKIACLLSKSLKVIHMGMCTQPRDKPKKQNPKGFSDKAQTEIKSSETSVVKEIILKKKAVNSNQPKINENTKNKNWSTRLGNIFLPTTNSIEENTNALPSLNKKLSLLQNQNPNKFNPLSLKKIFTMFLERTTNSYKPKLNTKLVNPKCTTPRHPSETTMKEIPTTQNSTNPEPTTTSISTSTVCTGSHSTAKDTSSTECSHEISTPPKFVSTTHVPPVPECSDLHRTTQSNGNTKCHHEKPTTTDHTTAECTGPEHTTTKCPTCSPTTPECTDLPSTVQITSTEKCTGEESTTTELTTTEYAPPETTTTICPTCLPTTPECSDIPSTTPECSDIPSTTPECNDIPSTTPGCADETPTTPALECSEVHTTSECFNEVPVKKRIICPTTPKCGIIKPPDKNEECTRQPKFCNPMPPKCVLKKTMARQNCNNICAMPECKPFKQQQCPGFNEDKRKPDCKPRVDFIERKPCLEKSIMLRKLKCKKTENTKPRECAENGEPQMQFMKKRRKVFRNKFLDHDMGCNFNCTNNGRPVCGSNGITYKNFCCLRKEKCLTKNPIRIVRKRNCKDFPLYQQKLQMSARGKSRFWFQQSGTKSFIKRNHRRNYGFRAVAQQEMGENILKQNCLDPLIQLD